MSQSNNRVMKNAAWIVGCKILQSVLSLVVTMLSARYLGPSNYGLINYAASIVTFMVPVMQLGFRSTLVQELVDAPQREGEIMGTAISLNVVASIACIIGVTAFSAIANRGEPETILVCALYSISLLFQATEMIQYWFQAKLLSRYTSVTMLVSYILVSIYKIWLLITGKSVYWFAVSYAIDYSIISAVLFVVYRRVGGLRMVFSWKLGLKMLDKSKYYILSGLMVTIFQQTDRVMLKLMEGNEVTGYYSAAVSCAGLAGFVYNAVIDSARPVIFEGRKRSTEKFEQNITRLYCVVFYLAIAQCLVSVLFAEPMIRIIYGADYLEAVNVLRVGVWFITFSYMGTVRNIWILAEGNQHLLLRINLSGAVANIVMNLALIPMMGALGAALASVLTQFFTNFVLGFLIKPLRRNNKLMIDALNPRYLLSMIRRR